MRIDTFVDDTDQVADQVADDASESVTASTRSTGEVQRLRLLLSQPGSIAPREPDTDRLRLLHEIAKGARGRVITPRRCR